MVNRVDTEKYLLPTLSYPPPLSPIRHCSPRPLPLPLLPPFPRTSKKSCSSPPLLLAQSLGDAAQGERRGDGAGLFFSRLVPVVAAVAFDAAAATTAAATTTGSLTDSIVNPIWKGEEQLLQRVVSLQQSREKRI